MADFEIIEEVGKAIPKGKDLKKMTPFIIGGLGLGVVALFMKRKDPPVDQNIMADDGVGSGVDLGGVLNDFANQTNQAIQQNNQEMSYKMSEISGNLLGIIQDQNSYLNDYKSEQNNIINQLKSDLANASKYSGGSSGGSSGSSYERVATVQSTRMAEDSYSSGSSIYFDDVDDDIQYNNVVKNLKDLTSSGQVSQKKATEIKKEIAGLGNNGVGWSVENYVGTASRLVNDPSYLSSEIERTKLVMENRQKAGLSTKLQEDHLNRLIRG